MPRPQKKRHVCCEPEHSLFSPVNSFSEEVVTLTVDEYECIRLIDLEGFTQEECSEQMNISRTTVQGIYVSAREKVADCIVNGKKLSITGGDYVLCKHNHRTCRKGCKKRCNRQADEIVG